MSVYNEKFNCFFIHIPRTGGTSISRSSLFKDSRYLGHRTIEELNTMMGDRFSGAYKFTIVRNPWDRVVSTYHFLRDVTEDDHWFPSNRDYHELCRQVSFEDFCHLLPEIYMDEIHLIPQIMWIYHNGISYCDYIGKYCFLQNDFDHVCDKIGYPRETLLNLNKSTHEAYRTYYNSETRDIVGTLYWDSVKLFDYEF